jgi:(E)-4-hydroxy-3-methylbut-2-enyl-diphosphate synthase
MNDMRRRTVTVKVGNVLIGSEHPIAVQTMVTTPTSDIEATMDECLRLAIAGADLVRVTVPTVRDAEALAEIHRRLRDIGCQTPLVADVHFNSEIAEIAAQYVEKVRINPGNFTDNQAALSAIGGTTGKISDSADLQRLRKRLLSLLDVCRQHSTALRIGVNHGSLSRRIMERYGDTPEGMVASAMEFLRICKRQQFDNVVVSMKSSNTRVMVNACRLLVKAMDAEKMHYPLHLGVTEAGDGEDGRVKSAAGIGALLLDGIGDTVRVSLTEPPENEIPVARAIVQYCTRRRLSLDDACHRLNIDNASRRFDDYRRKTLDENVGKKYLVLADRRVKQNCQPAEPQKSYIAPDFLLSDEPSDAPDCIQRDAKTVNVDIDIMRNSEFVGKFMNESERMFIIDGNYTNNINHIRAILLKMQQDGYRNPCILSVGYDRETDFDDVQIKAACDLGALLLDGLGDGVMIVAPHFAPQITTDLSFRILQATRARFTRTEYIACPGCGRTLFDLRETLQKVKQATAHLENLKIGVMGCIVNGPGEMADADYGYVGAGHGRVTLFKGKTPVKKNIPQEDAINELLTLIGNEK